MRHLPTPISYYLLALNCLLSRLWPYNHSPSSFHLHHCLLKCKHWRLSKRWIPHTWAPTRTRLRRRPRPPQPPVHRRRAICTAMNIGSSSHGLASLDDVIQHITTSSNPQNLKSYLNSFAPKESRETILASTLGSGQDPLSVLDPAINTLGFLYIL